MNIPKPYELSSYYTMITSMRYNDGDTIEYMMEEITKVRMFLIEQADMYTLKGSMKGIHISLIMEDLKEFSKEELIGYISMFQRRDNYQLGIYNEKESSDLMENNFLSEEAFKTYLLRYTLNLKMMNLEKFRIWSFIEAIFFSPYPYRPELFEGTLHFHDIPDLEEILKNGIEYYFIRSGEVTVNELLERYERFELIHIAALLVMQTERDFIFSNIMSNREISSIIMMCLEDSMFNPFSWITVITFHLTHNFSGERSTINVNENLAIDRNEYMALCAWEGIRVLTPKSNPLLKSILYQNYVKSQLSPSFILEVEENRTNGEAIDNTYLLDNSIVEYEDFNNIILYGIRDGVSKYHAYTIKELENTFIDYNEFFLPDTVHMYPNKPRRWGRFSIPAIKVLVNHILPSKTDSANLINIINRILLSLDEKRSHRFYPSVVMELISPQNKHLFNLEMLKGNVASVKGKVEISKCLVEMMNTGLILYEWDRTMLALFDDDIEKKAINLPERNYLDPKWESNLRKNIMDYIIRTTNVIEENMNGRCGELRLVYIQDDEKWISYDYDDEDTIMGTLRLMSDCVKFGLFECIRQHALNLYISSIYYGKELLNQNITNITLDWE